jgi:hypothetical protein
MGEIWVWKNRLLTPIPERRGLRADEMQLLAWLLRQNIPASTPYVEQLGELSVVSRCGCGCPTIDFAVGGRAAQPGSPSTILADTSGVSPEGVRVGIIVHAREGLISELEIYPIAGDASTFSLPRIEDVDP